MLLAIRRRLILNANTTTDRFEPLTGWIPTSGTSYFVGLIAICNKTSTFRAKLAIQVAGTDVLVPTTTYVTLTTNTGSGTGLGYQTAIGKAAFNADLRDAQNGDIDGGPLNFRLGLLYSDSGNGIGEGDVYVEGTIQQS